MASGMKIREAPALRGFRRRSISSTLLLCSLLVLSACRSPYAQGGQGLATLRIALKSQAQARMIRPEAPSMTPTSFDITITNSGDPIALTGYSASTATFASVPAGAVTIRVVGYNAEGEAILQGSADLILADGETENVSIVLKPGAEAVPNGTMAFTIGWDESLIPVPSYLATIKPKGGSFAPLTGFSAISGGVLSYPATDWPVGDYVISVLFYNNGKFVASVVLGAVVYPGQLSSEAYALPSTAISQPPEPPSGLSATATSDSLVELSWTDNSLVETSFTVAYSDNGSDWTEITGISPNATSYAAPAPRRGSDALLPGLRRQQFR